MLRIFRLSITDDTALEARAAADVGPTYGFNCSIDIKGYVVIAHSKQGARNLANSVGGSPWWFNADQTLCEEVLLDGPERLVLANEPAV